MFDETLSICITFTRSLAVARKADEIDNLETICCVRLLNKVLLTASEAITCSIARGCSAPKADVPTKEALSNGPWMTFAASDVDATRDVVT